MRIVNVYFLYYFLVERGREREREGEGEGGTNARTLLLRRRHKKV